MAYTKIPVAIMRGGTSKAAVFYDKDLPEDIAAREAFILRAMGNPDPKQMDGLGGATLNTSKVVVIHDGDKYGADIAFTFYQVFVSKPGLTTKALCGNISTAVGPYAIENGFVKPEGDGTCVVKAYNTNTKKYLQIYVPVVDGKVNYCGDYVTPGICEPSSKMVLEFCNPEGTFTPSLLPSGNATDVVTLPDGSTARVSLVDATSPYVFIDAEDLGVKGDESPAQFQALANKAEVLKKMDYIRDWAAVKCGLASSIETAKTEAPTLPKAGWVAKVAADDADADISSRMFTDGKMNPAYMATTASCAATAANIEGTIIARLTEGSDTTNGLRIRHSTGIMKASLRSDENCKYIYVDRSARMIMDGNMYLDM